MKQLKNSSAHENVSSGDADSAISVAHHRYPLTPQLVRRLFTYVPLDKSSRGCFASYLPSSALMALLGHASVSTESPVKRRNVERGLIEYLRDEIERIILTNTNQLADELVMIRLHSLLERMVKHFGCDPVNPCFMRFLRIAMKQFNYKTCLYLIENDYVKLSSLADTNLRPDMLFLLLFYCRNHSSLVHTSLPVDYYCKESLFTSSSTTATSCNVSSVNSPPVDGTSLLLLIQLLLPYADVNCYQASHMSSILDLLVDLSESEILDTGTCNTDRKTLAACADIAVNLIIDRKQLDIPHLMASSDGLCNPIQRAVDGHKFTLALKLIKTTCKQCVNINKLFTMPSCIIVSPSLVDLFQFVYLLGYTLPDTETFARTLHRDTLADPSHLLDSFIHWLHERRQHPLPLRALAWNILRKNEMIASTDLLKHYLLNLDLTHYMTGESFQLLFT